MEFPPAGRVCNKQNHSGMNGNYEFFFLLIMAYFSLGWLCGKCGGLMVSVVVPESSGLGLSSGSGHCVVFLGKTIYSHSLSPPRCINGTSEFNAGGSPAMD